MAKISKLSAKAENFGPVTDHSGQLEEYTVGFTTFHESIDQESLLKGLPDDQCQCPHWGYVLKGTWRVRIGDREEVYKTGEAFYMPPGHVPLDSVPDTEILLFSPTEQLRPTEEAIERNLQAMQAGRT